MSQGPLQALARAAGLLVEWEDAEGRPQVVGEDALQAVLAALGYPAETEAQARESRRRLAEGQAAEALAFLTADAGRPFTVPVATSERMGRLRLENGELQTLTLRATADGLEARIQTSGYHTLEIGEQEIPIAVAPARALAVSDLAPGGPIWGTAVQVYGLRGARPAPFGDFAALRDFVRSAGAAGAGAVAISPVHALFAADPGRFSPYGPSSRLFLNGLFGDPALVPGDGGGLEDSGALIHWASAAPAKLAALRQAYARLSASPALQGAFEDFRASGGADLEGHARFEALHGRFFAERGARGWQDWPAAYHDAAGSAAADFARQAADEVRFHAFLQWLADASLQAAQAEAKAAGMPLGLITDLAIGMDAGGSHAWSRPGDLLQGLSVGAPPDIFQAQGQDWGIAALSPQALRRGGFAPFLATLRAAMRHAGGVRIDHAMGLRRLWLVPHGAEATGGAYLAYPMADMLRLLALESRRARAVVIGEDLGTVPAGFRDALDARGVMGMRVLWFERGEDGGFTPSTAWSPTAAALTTTHDLPTVAGWWRGRDIDLRAELGQEQPGDRAERQSDREALWAACKAQGCAEGPPPPPEAPEAAVDAAAAFVADAPCALAIVAIEDLLGLEEQPNLPGTVDEHPNWRRRLPAAADRLLAGEAPRRRIDRLNARRP